MELAKLWLDALPKRVLTATVGAFSRRSLSRYCIPFYVKMYGIDPTEAEQDIREYTCLAAFFSRRLHDKARPTRGQDIVAPVDGRIQGFGDIEDGQLVQAKGSHYSIAALLGSPVDAEHFHGGQYATLYLSPGDYHRIHMPMAGVLKRWRYIPGKLFPVNKLGVQHVTGLFTKNERLVTFAETSDGDVAIVKVGATIVGSIKTPYGPSHRGPFSKSRRCPCEGQTWMQKSLAEEIGYFEFGSTVVLLFAPSIRIDWMVHEGQFVRMGEELGRLRGSGNLAE